MKKFIFLFFMTVNIAFAATTEEVENNFQKGLQYSQQGMVDEAINEFNKVTLADPSSLPKDYYVQTYSEAFFDIGILYAKKGDDQKAIENFKKSVEIFPDHKRSLYYLAGSLVNLGEIAEAKLYYDRAKLLGFTSDPHNIQAGDFVGNLSIEYQPKELSVEYQPYFDNEKKSVTIQIKGNPCVDKELILDTIRQLEKMEYMDKRGIFSDIDAEFVRWEKGKTIAKQKWIVKGQQGQKTYWISFNFSPPVKFPYKTMITVSENE